MSSLEDDIKALDYAIDHIEAELRDRPPSQERVTAMLEVIVTLRSMRAELKEEAVKRLSPARQE